MPRVEDPVQEGNPALEKLLGELAPLLNAPAGAATWDALVTLIDACPNALLPELVARSYNDCLARLSTWAPDPSYEERCAQWFSLSGEPLFAHAETYARLCDLVPLPQRREPLRPVLDHSCYYQLNYQHLGFLSHCGVHTKWWASVQYTDRSRAIERVREAANRVIYERPTLFENVYGGDSDWLVNFALPALYVYRRGKIVTKLYCRPDFEIVTKRGRYLKIEFDYKRRSLHTVRLADRADRTLARPYFSKLCDHRLVKSLKWSYGDYAPIGHTLTLDTARLEAAIPPLGERTLLPKRSAHPYLSRAVGQTIRELPRDKLQVFLGQKSLQNDELEPDSPTPWPGVLELETPNFIPTYRELHQQFRMASEAFFLGAPLPHGDEARFARVVREVADAHGVEPLPLREEDCASLALEGEALTEGMSVWSAELSLRAGALRFGVPAEAAGVSSFCAGFSPSSGADKRSAANEYARRNASDDRDRLVVRVLLRLEGDTLKIGRDTTFFEFGYATLLARALATGLEQLASDASPSAVTPSAAEA